MYNTSLQYPDCRTLHHSCLHFIGAERKTKNPLSALLLTTLLTLTTLLRSAPARAQDLYVSTYESTIVKITQGGVLSLFASGDGLEYPYGLAFATSGDLYAVRNPGGIRKISPEGNICVFATQDSGVGHNSAGLVIDSSGNLYAAHASFGLVIKVTPKGVGSIFATVDLGAQGMAIDSIGNIYVACYNSNTIYRITPDGIVTFFATASHPWGLAFDPSGNLYVSSAQDNTINKITPAGVSSPFASGGLLYTPAGLTCDTSGNLYVANFNGSNILKIDPAGIVSVFFSGNGLNYPVYLTFGPRPDAILTVQVTGTIALEECLNSAQPLTMTFRPQQACSSEFSRTVTLAGDASFTLTDVPRGIYTVHIKGAKWLSKNVEVNTITGNVSGVNRTLLAGDANNDNVVDVLDLDALIKAFDADPSSLNWNNGVADFNCDDSVDVIDLDLLIRNFDVEGDT